MNTPNQLPAGGRKFEFRATAVDPTLDQLLAAFTMKEPRKALPGFLYLFSQQTYNHVVDDVYDGYSKKDHLFSSYRHQVLDVSRSKFSLDASVDKQRGGKSGELTTYLELKINLGLGGAASRVFAPPFFEGYDSDLLTMHYTIPKPTRGLAMPQALDNLREYLDGTPRGIVDELIIVESAMRNRIFASRSRQRIQPEPEITDEVQVVESKAEPAA